jgi:hypothetical protein
MPAAQYLDGIEFVDAVIQPVAADPGENHRVDPDLILCS